MNTTVDIIILSNNANDRLSALTMESVSSYINTIPDSVLNTVDLLKDGYTKITNYNIQNYQSDGLSFRLIYNKRMKYSYKFRVHIKIQA